MWIFGATSQDRLLHSQVLFHLASLVRKSLSILPFATQVAN